LAKSIPKAPTVSKTRGTSPLPRASKTRHPPKVTALVMIITKSNRLNCNFDFISIGPVWFSLAKAKKTSENQEEETQEGRAWAHAGEVQAPG
jgi:hypothetical protein